MWLEGGKIITAEVCPDHVHASGNTAENEVSGFMGFLKGKSSIMIYQKWRSMKYNYRNRSFLCRGIQ